MKKLLVFMVAMLYITVTSGVVVNVHYCMDKMVSVSYGHEKDRSCGNCGMEAKSDCCRTEHKFVKSEIDQLLNKAAVQYSLLPAVAILPVNSVEQVASLAAQKHLALPRYHSPPDQRSNVLSVYTCVFRV